MQKSKIILKLFSKISAAVILLLSSVSISLGTVKANDTTPKELTQVISNVELLDASDTKQNVDSEGDYNLRTGTAYKLRVPFDLKKYNENLNNGDYFTFDIPEPMTVYSDTQPLVDPNTNIEIGTAVVTSNGINKGGKVTVTLKNLDKYLEKTGGDKVKDVSGNFSASFRFTEDQNKTPIIFNSTAMQQEVRHTYNTKTTTGPKIGTENYAKAGGQSSRTEWDSPKLAAIGSTSKGDVVSNWRVRVNTEKEDFGENIILHDIIPNDDPSYTPAQYIPESLKIYKADITGGTSAVPADAELMVEGKDYTVAWNENYTSFDVIIKDGKSSYFITYNTTAPNDGTKVANTVALSKADGTKLAQNTSRPGALSMKAEATSLISGTIVASTAYQIKINKTDAFTLAPVSGAVYTVTAVDDPTETTEVTTNEKGFALTKTYDQKWEGKTFKIKEKTAPAGYTLDEKEYTLTLGAAGSTINLKDKPIPAPVNITAKKVVSGREGELPKADEFTFNLYSANNLTTPIATAKTKADGSITFENIEVKGVGVYNYVIKEDTTNAVPGVTFDETAKEVTVKAEFQGTTLKASVTSPEPTFTNTYKAAETKATITATKALNGSTLKDDQFEFELKEGAKVVGTAKNKADGTVTFEDITYTEAGVHTYTLTEKEGTEGGVTYDKTSHEVKVEVTDNGQGKLVVAVTGNNPAFTNTYKAAETKATITATKALNGSTLKDDQFEFELKEGAKVVGTAKNKADGTITFEDITYTEAGVHTYTLTEKEGTEGGVTYDKTSHEVKVEVTDNGQGKLVVAVTGNNPAFTNTYKAAETKATITATKALNGSTLKDDQFEFELKEGAKVVGTAKNKADGTVTFEDITYTEVGEHEYTVTEKAGNEAGVIYDSKSYTVKVKVTDNGQGQLVATVTDNNPTITNTYKAAETKATITATKALNGSTLKDDQFEFELKEGAKVVGTAKNKADGTVTFEDITYTEAGVHTYTLTEKEGTEGGVTYDKTSHEVKVEVTDNGQGKLVVAVTGNNPAFTNTYKAAETKATITATKALNGSTLKDDQFEFELKEGAKVVGTAKNKADGTVTFEDITYTEVGEHEYTVTEKAGNEAGVIYDSKSYTVKVKVTDNGQGQLEATVTDNNPTITNTYKAAETKATITATKALNGSTLKDDQFEFELKEGAKVLGTAKNKADGTITFEDITYTEAGVHTYTLTEKEGTEGGVTYDKTSHEVKVEVTDNGQGKLVVAVTGNNPAFTNTYKAAETKATITATKALNGSTLKDDQFEFELKEGAKVVGTAKNKADGTVTFEDITYTEAGVHTYTLTEKEGTEGGVTYDKTSHEVKVEVTDNGQGKLVVAVTGNNPAFTNTYKAAETKATITAKKVLEGKALEADKYEFELKEGTKVVGTAKNKADGTVTFEDITYTEVGEHEYTVTEKAGNEAGVTYDSKSYTVKVKVTDNGQGQLVATVTDNNPTITNTYKAVETKATITAKKVLEGKALEADKYEFELKEGTKVVGTAKNKADGTVTFEDITYTEVGEHEYTVTEKAGNEAGVTYDSKSYTVKVKVTDNGQGQLEATVTGDGDNVTFINKYNKPTPENPVDPKDPKDLKPKKPLPNTGATDSPVLPGLLGFALMAVSAFLYRAKNNN